MSDDRTLYPAVWIRLGEFDFSRRVLGGPIPTITAIEFERSDHPTVPIATFPTLTAAEDALRAAFEAHPPHEAVRTVVRVTWDEGSEQRATLVTDATTVRDRGGLGLIKWHLMELGRSLLSANSVAARAWGAEVRHRLVNDRSDPTHVAADAAWRDSLRFLPSDDGAPPPPIVEVVAAFGEEILPIADGPGAVRFASVAAADAAIARFVTKNRVRGDAVVSLRVTWADGMAFKCWFSPRDPDLPTPPVGLVFRAMEMKATTMLSDAYADSNERAIPYRPLAPQQAWARELLRRIGRAASDEIPRNARRASSAAPTIRSVVFTSCESEPIRRAVTGQEFRSLSAADDALARAVSEHPADAGRVGFRVTWTDDATHEGIAAVTRADADRASVGHTAIIRRHLRAYALTTAQAAKLGALLGASGAATDARHAWGAELLRRLDADDADRGALRNDDSATAPTIREVAILWAENNAVPLRTFPSLWEADAAMMQALRGAEFDGARLKVGFLVSWTDGASYEGRVDVDADALARAARAGGLIREFLDATAQWLQGDRFRALFGPHFSAERIAHDQAWGRELALRLDADRLQHDDPTALRNRAWVGAR